MSDSAPKPPKIEILQARFDGADRLQVLVELGLIGPAQLSAEILRVVEHQIDNALIVRIAACGLGDAVGVSGGAARPIGDDRLPAAKG